jgi:hypothetical protein
MSLALCVFAVDGFSTEEALRAQRFFDVLLFGYSGRIIAAHSILLKNFLCAFCASAVNKKINRRGAENTEVF